MSPLHFFLHRIKKDTFSLIFLLLCAIFISNLFCYSFYTIDRYTYLLRTAKQGDLEHVTVCYYKPFQSPTQEEIDDVYAAIEEIPGNHICATYSSLQANDVNGVMIDLSVYSSAFQNVKYPLSEGTWPSADTANQIVLAYDYKDIYEVGQEIQLQVITGISSDGKGLICRESSAIVTVCGFLEKNASTLEFNSKSNQADLSDLFAYDSYQGILMSLIDTDGNPIQYETIPNFFVIRSLDDEDQAAIEDDLAAIVGSQDLVHTGAEMFAGYKENNKDLFEEALYYSVISITFAVTAVFSSTLLAALNRRKEMSIYYMCGATWQRSVRLVLFAKIPVIIFGSVMGCLWYAYSDQGMYCMKPIYAVLSIAAILFFFSLGIIPFYLSTCRKSPIDLFRKD